MTLLPLLRMEICLGLLARKMGGGAGRGAIKTNREAFSFVFYPLIPFGQAKSRDLLEVHFLDKTKSERINKGKIVVELGQFSKQFS